MEACNRMYLSGYNRKIGIRVSNTAKNEIFDNEKIN